MESGSGALVEGRSVPPAVYSSLYTSVEKEDRSVTGEANERLSLKGSGGAMTPVRSWTVVAERCDTERSDCL